MSLWLARGAFSLHLDFAIFFSNHFYFNADFDVQTVTMYDTHSECDRQFDAYINVYSFVRCLMKAHYCVGHWAAGWATTNQALLSSTTVDRKDDLY